MSKKRNQPQSNNLTPKQLYPKTDNQSDFLTKYSSDKHQLLLGHPGTGKTYLALHSAILDLHDNPDKYQQIIIVRSPVQTTDIGHTPGTVQEKAAVYEGPYPSIVNKIYGRGDAYELLKKKEIIKFELTTFLRGDTFNNTIVIVDELQNCNSHVADTILTRIGNNSKLIMCGDLQQRDLTKHSDCNIEKFLRVIEFIKSEFEYTHFTTDDIVRSGLVKSYIKAKFKIFEQGY